MAVTNPAPPWPPWGWHDAPPAWGSWDDCGLRYPCAPPPPSPFAGASATVSPSASGGAGSSGSGTWLAVRLTVIGVVITLSLVLAFLVIRRHSGALARWRASRGATAAGAAGAPGAPEGDGDGHAAGIGRQVAPPSGVPAAKDLHGMQAPTARGVQVVIVMPSGEREVGLVQMERSTPPLGAGDAGPSDVTNASGHTGKLH